MIGVVKNEKGCKDTWASKKLWNEMATKQRAIIKKQMKTAPKFMLPILKQYLTLFKNK